MSVNMNPKQVIDNYWERGKLPIDPIVIAKKAGISVTELPSKDKKQNISGLYIPPEINDENFIIRPAEIQVNMNEPKKRIRFTVAHELGHHFLKHGKRPRDTTDAFRLSTIDRYEIEANCFAAELLMPKEYVAALYLREGINQIEKLAEKFNVSLLAMKFRLQNLGYIPS